LARAKKLNPVTGLPRPESPDFVKNTDTPLLCRSGDPCPKSGYWQVALLPYVGISQQAILYFNQGTRMPTDPVEIEQSRIWPLSPKRVIQDQVVDWLFLSEA
jgi:hypothetical protein